MSLAHTRLAEERRAFRKDHPPGFFARPTQKRDGSLDLLTWACGIPGPAGSDWEGGVYKLALFFTEDYPAAPPKVQFTPTIFHPNVYPSGTVCLSIVNQDGDWKPSITIKQILMGVQDLLINPNNSDPAQGPPSVLLRNDPEAYSKRCREEAKRFAPRV